METPFRGGTWRRRSRAPADLSGRHRDGAGHGGHLHVRGPLPAGRVLRRAVHHHRGLRSQGARCDPYVALVRASVLAAEQGRAVPSDLTPGLVALRKQTASLGDCDYRTGTRELCPIGDPDAERSIVVLGDSHARAISPALVKIGEDLGYRVYVLVFSGCSANSVVQVDPATGREWDDCEDFKDWADDTIADLHPDLLVVSTSAGGSWTRTRGRCCPVPVASRRTSRSSSRAGRTCSRACDPRRARSSSSATPPSSRVRPGSASARAIPTWGTAPSSPDPGPSVRRGPRSTAARAAGVGVVDAAEVVLCRRAVPVGGRPLHHDAGLRARDPRLREVDRAPVGGRSRARRSSPRTGRRPLLTRDSELQICSSLRAVVSDAWG